MFRYPFGVLWIVFAVLWIVSPDTLGHVHNWIVGLPLVLEIIVWIVFLPWVGSLFIWHTGLALWLKILIDGDHRRGVPETGGKTPAHHLEQTDPGLTPAISERAGFRTRRMTCQT